MAPEGSHASCNFTIVNGVRQNEYANCHRYDQSAINIILGEIFYFILFYYYLGTYYNYNTTKYCIDINDVGDIRRQ
jgi:hypothetical protein